MKKVLSVLLVIIMAMTSIVVFVPTMEVEAKAMYELLFPVQNGGVNIYCYYGYSAEYFNNTKFHKGLDIHSNGDDTIYSSSDGKVIQTFNHCQHINGVNCTEAHKNTWGNSVIVEAKDSNDNTYHIIYGHLKYDTITVKVGDYVVKGQPLAQMGSSGNSTGKHLHLELRSYWGNPENHINSNPTSKGGLVNYSTIGYQDQPEFTPATITDGDYYIKNDEYYLYIAKDQETWNLASAAGSVIPSETSKSSFNIEIDGSNYKISPTTSEYDNALNVLWDISPNNATMNGNEISLWKSSGSKSQRWIFEEKDGGYVIRSVDNLNLCITRVSESKIEARTYTGASNQIWTLEGTEVECEHDWDIFLINDGTPAATSEYHMLQCTKCKKKWSELHEYSNDCDSTCNGCGYTRTASAHKYDNDCDSNCNICGHERETLPHVYDYGCDDDCNVCGYEKPVGEIVHDYVSAYSNNAEGHWYDCTNCGEKGTVEVHIPSAAATEDTAQTCTVCGYVIQGALGHTHDCSNEYEKDANQHWYECECGAKTDINDHVYDNGCDTSCDACGYIRMTNHTYDDGCDTDCNQCGYIRTTQHVYDHNCDTDCNVCGDERETEHIFDDEKDAECNECGFVREIDDENNDVNNGGENNTDNEGDNNTGNEPDNENGNEGGNHTENEGMDQKTVVIIAVASVVTILGLALIFRKRS